MPELEKVYDLTTVTKSSGNQKSTRFTCHMLQNTVIVFETSFRDFRPGEQPRSYRVCAIFYTRIWCIMGLTSEDLFRPVRAASTELRITVEVNTSRGRQPSGGRGLTETELSEHRWSNPSCFSNAASAQQVDLPTPDRPAKTADVWPIFSSPS